MHLAGDIDFNAVRLDQVRLRGIRMLNPGLKSKWTQIAYGGHNAGSAASLFGPMMVKADIYYHKRKWMSGLWKSRYREMKKWKP